MLLIAVVLVLAGLAPSSADAARSCSPITVESSGEWVTASVRVFEGAVSCRTARRVGRRLVSREARYVNNGYGYNSYYVVGRWWRGANQTGAWRAVHQGNGASVGGTIRF